MNLINPGEAQKMLYNWIDSEEYNSILNSPNCEYSKEFKSGFIFGLAIAGVLINTRMQQYHVDINKEESIKDNKLLDGGDII